MTASAATDLVQLDAPREIERLTAVIRHQVFDQLKRKGVVIGISGGIDSGVAAALCARALGPERVFGIFMPESESSSESLRLGRILLESLGIPSVLEDISATLSAAGCYRRRDEAIRRLLPEYTDQYKFKIVLPPISAKTPYAVFTLVAESPAGVETRIRLTADVYRTIVAATNFKQRTRKMMEYYHADRLHYAVVGTPNRLEYDQGFFVKNGDGAADIKPIAHLFKSQVYHLAACLNIPEEIQSRVPTTDTYSLAQSQEEFYFSIPLRQMDVCLYGKNHGMPPETIADAAGLSPAQVAVVYSQIESKRRATCYLHMRPLLAEEVPITVEKGRSGLHQSSWQ